MQALGAKLRFNRMVRAMTASALGVRAAGVTARVAPALVRKLIIDAGDAA
jgi:hypothetical protein